MGFFDSWFKEEAKAETPRTYTVYVRNPSVAVGTNDLLEITMILAYECRGTVIKPKIWDAVGQPCITAKAYRMLSDNLKGYFREFTVTV